MAQKLLNKGLFKIWYQPHMFEEMTDDDFLCFCKMNEPLVFERDKMGKIIAMAPTGSESGKYNSVLNAELYNWNKKKKLGYLFDSSSGFKLPNSAVRSPDCSFIKKEKWRALSQSQKEKFAPLCPDFVAEIKSPSDTLEELQDKMVEYMENGASLGWLIDVKDVNAYVYTSANQSPLIYSFETVLNGGETVPGFEFDLKQLNADD